MLLFVINTITMISNHAHHHYLYFAALTSIYNEHQLGTVQHMY